MEKAKTSRLDLIPQIGLITAIAYGVGSVIGSGIFKKPGLMAAQLGSPILLIIVWLVTGLMTLFGALSIAEIASIFPRSGGLYIYFNECYNRLTGYLYGWAVFIVIQTGSIASIAYVFSDSLGYFFNFFRLPASWEAFAIHIPYLGVITPFKFLGLKLCTIALVLFLTFVNYLAVSLGGAVQVIFTVLKIGAILAIVFFAFLFGGGNLNNFTTSSLPLTAGNGSTFLAFIVAMSGAFWVYDGWINVTYSAAEIKNSRKNLPRTLFYSALIYILIYLLINLAYIYIIPVPEMAHKYVAAEETGQAYLVATDVAGSFWGKWGGAMIALAISVSTFGTVNGTIMLSARVYFAMAREGLFPRRMGEVHPRFRTPARSLLIQGIWTSLLVLSGTFDQLTDMLIFVSWIFYALGTLGVIVLRKKKPDAPRTYRVWGYPVLPIVFIIFSLIFLGFTLYSDISSYTQGRTPLINSLMGVVLVAAGLPGYLYWNWKDKKRAHVQSKIT
jgi:APA family basic amino acid/polyamine antiporter